MKTKKGGNCHADVTCADGNTRNYDNWGGCAHQVVNRFDDPGIGPFTITWTKKDDDCDDGLCAPELALGYVGDYHVFDVSALSEEAQDNANSATLCKVGCSAPTPDSEPNPENICQETYKYNRDTIHAHQCGVPAIGKNYGPGKLDSQGPVNPAGYAGGWCGIHVVQHQKEDPAGDPASDPKANYHLDVTLYDSNQDKIGEVLGAEAPAGKAVERIIATSGNTTRETERETAGSAVDRRTGTFLSRSPTLNSVSICSSDVSHWVSLGGALEEEEEEIDDFDCLYAVLLN
ncbi:MAG: hypothetical protein Q9173_005439 [Seirophora scorigena]